jgi:hypothetical protein
VLLLLPPDKQLAEAFRTFPESGGHFSVPAGPAPRRRARRPQRQGQGTCERVSYASPFVRYFQPLRRPILPSAAGWPGSKPRRAGCDLESSWRLQPVTPWLFLPLDGGRRTGGGCTPVL